MYSLQVRSRHGGKRSGSAGRGASAYEGIELELELIQTQMAQKPMLRAEVYGIVVGVSPIDSGHEKRSSGADRGAGVGIAVDALAKGSGHGGKRSGDASRCSSACVGIVVGGRAKDSGLDK